MIFAGMMIVYPNWDAVARETAIPQGARCEKTAR